MVETTVITLVGGGVVTLGVWYAKGRLSTVVTTDDVDPQATPTEADLSEVRDMAQRAIDKATEAQAAANTAASEVESLAQLLVENDSEFDEPLLVRFQDRLDSIEAELQRQSRVETERAVSMGRIAAVLEDMEGVDADAVDMEELAEQLPESGPLSAHRED